MSTRSRSTTDSYGRIITHNSSTVVDDTLSFTDFSETISSEDIKFEGIGNVNHSRTSIVQNGQTHTYYGGTSGTSDVWRSAPCAFGVGMIDSMPNDSIDWPSLQKEAFLAMKPTMESKFSATNFLLELRDLKDLGRIWDTSKGIAKNIASGNLQYHYGWKSTFDDAKEIYQNLLGFEAKLNDFLNREGVPQKRYFRKYVGTSAADVESPFLYWGNDRVKYVYTYDIPSTYNAVMRYRYYLPNISRTAFKIRALADHFGLKFNASVLWNAIPFSFMVDWFVRIGDFLEQFNNNYIEPQIEITDFSESLKRKITTKVYCRRNVSNPNNSAWCLSHTVSHSTYFRRRVVPSLSTWVPLGLGLDGWDYTRYGLAASLFTTRW